MTETINQNELMTDAAKQDNTRQEKTNKYWDIIKLQTGSGV